MRRTRGAAELFPTPAQEHVASFIVSIASSDRRPGRSRSIHGPGKRQIVHAVVEGEHPAGAPEFAAPAGSGERVRPGRRTIDPQRERGAAGGPRGAGRSRPSRARVQRSDHPGAQIRASPASARRGAPPSRLLRRGERWLHAVTCRPTTQGCRDGGTRWASGQAVTSRASYVTVLQHRFGTGEDRDVAQTPPKAAWRLLHRGRPRPRSAAPAIAAWRERVRAARRIRALQPPASSERLIEDVEDDVDLVPRDDAAAG